MEAPGWSSDPRYPDLNLDIFQLPKAIHEFLDRFGLSTPKVVGNGPPSPSYAHVTAFFGGVVEALNVMKDQVTLELLCGELTQELSRMRFGGHEDRPETFPTEYTRAYLSNVSSVFPTSCSTISRTDRFQGLYAWHHQHDCICSA
jgi:hypothetical protein